MGVHVAAAAVAAAVNCLVVRAAPARDGGSSASSSAPPPPSLRFATSYGSHMVLQQRQSAVVWGWCAHPPCAVGVSLNGVAATVLKPTVPGTWIVKLPPTEGGPDPHTVTVSEGGSTVSISDVLFGDVWVCSGQSNMAFLLENAFNGSALVKDADNHPEIRLFTSKKLNSGQPLLEQPSVEEQWTVSSHTTVSDDGCPNCNSSTVTTGWGSGLGDDNWLYMSAVCYLYGREIQAKTGKPVGLVNTNWGGTPVEFWSSEDAMSECGNGTAGGAYNGMIKPLLNMTISGAIWYQGEANTKDAYTETDPQGLPMASYGCRFPAMIADWRSKWHAGSLQETAADFPFGFVSLAAWLNPNNSPAGVRWSQTAGYGVLPNPAMPNTFDAIAIDLLDRKSPFGSVHIRDKTTVSQRLAAAGIATAYNGGSSAYWQGPVVDTAVLTGSSISVTFANTGANGIELRNSSWWEVCTLAPTKGSQVSDAPNCSSLAEANATTPAAVGQWVVAAAAQASPSSVTVSLGTMPAGKLVVRYAWASAPFEYMKAGLYAKDEGSPAGPFVKIASRP